MKDIYISRIFNNFSIEELQSIIDEKVYDYSECLGIEELTVDDILEFDKEIINAYMNADLATDEKVIDRVAEGIGFSFDDAKFNEVIDFYKALNEIMEIV